MKVVIVYASQYLINLGGLEKLHPYDTRKYERIYNQLIRDRLLTPQDVCAPEPLDDSAILRVHTPEYLQSLENPDAVATYLEAPMMASTATVRSTWQTTGRGTTTAAPARSGSMATSAALAW